MTSPPRTVPRGRRPGSPDTRGEVLAAARAEFAERGYDAATVRGIAVRAGVDPALVHHYFGSKERVFVAAMQLPIDPPTLVSRILDGPRDELGERVARTFLGVWSSEGTRAPLLAMLRSAVTAEPAAAMLRQFVGGALLGPIAAGVGTPDAPLRVSLAAAQLVGVAMLRFVIRVEPLASADEDEVVALVGPTIQRYLTG